MSFRSADDHPATVAFDALADPRRRHLLAILSTRTDPPAATRSRGESPSEPLSIDTLATDVTSNARGQPIVTTEECSRTKLSLVHSDLPRLEDAGIVTCEGSGGATAVSPAAHPLFEREWVQLLLENPCDGGLEDAERLNRTLEAFQSARRRTICQVLARHRGPVPVADLAALVAADEGDADRRLADVTPEDCRAIETELVHSHLPALDDIGLVAYDREETDDADGTDSVAIATDAPQWRTDWLAASPLGSIPDRLEIAPASRRPTAMNDGGEPDATMQAGTCATIEGTENVLECGHAIADSATEELFVTVPDEGFLQQRCLERWREAADRGVDIYVGSRSPQVRDIVRAAVPDATVCEPQFDWINFPIEQLHHGRVVFADRRRVMLVTVDDESHCPTAITGDGAENALVSLVREHVGPRLDRLDRLEADREESERPDGTPSPLPM